MDEYEINGYSIEKYIGKSNTKIYKVIKNGKAYAAKFYNTSQSSIALEEIKINEAINQYRNKIDRLITILDWFEDDNGNYWLIMEYCKGDTLTKFIKSHISKDMTENEKIILVDLFRQAVDCLNQLHNLGFVHRDIKPDNFMFLDRNQTKLRLIDFGLSVQEQRLKFCPCTSYGTTGFGPAISKNNPQAADVFALGITLSMAIFKVHPFMEEHDHYRCNWQILCQHNINENNIIMKTKFKKNEMGRIILKMLDSDEDNRPSIFDLAFI